MLYVINRQIGGFIFRQYVGLIVSYFGLWLGLIWVMVGLLYKRIYQLLKNNLIDFQLLMKLFSI
jgi:hypothetical protein